MDKLTEIASGRQSRPTEKASPGRQLLFAGLAFALLCVFMFASEVWTARSVRSDLQRALGGRRVLLIDIEHGAGVICGSYRIVGEGSVWLFVRDTQQIWPENNLPSGVLPPAIEHEYVACDTYRSANGRGSRTFWFAPQVRTVANWR
jgi:hypothetical protein